MIKLHGEILELERELNVTLYDYSDSSYLDEVIMEIAEGNVPNYTVDIINGVGKLYVDGYIDEMLNEYEHKDFIQLLIVSWAKMEEDKIYNDIDNLILHYALSHLCYDLDMEYISIDFDSKLKSALEDIDVQRLWDIVNVVEDCISDFHYETLEYVTTVLTEHQEMNVDLLGDETNLGVLVSDLREELGNVKLDNGRISLG